MCVCVMYVGQEVSCLFLETASGTLAVQIRCVNVPVTVRQALARLRPCTSVSYHSHSLFRIGVTGTTIY